VRPSTSSERSLDIGVFGIRGIPSTYSGYETFLTALLPILADRGHRVTVYARIGEGDDHTADATPDAEPSVYQGVNVVPVRSLRTKQLDTITHGFACAAKARRKHDVLFVCNVANAPVLMALRAIRVPSVLNVDGQEWLRGKWGRAGRTWFKGSAYLSRAASSALVADCRAMADVYRDQFHAESTVIPYSLPGSVAAAAAISDDEIAQILARYHLDRNSYFLTGGRMVPENNIDYIAEAYHHGSRSEPLVIIGKANYDSPVVRRIQELAAIDDRIRLIGHIDDRLHFGALFRGATAYAHGHSVGGMNPSLVEAMGVGTIVTALDTPFNREVLADHGVYFERNHASIVNALTAAAERGPDDRRAIAERAVDEYDLGTVADAYEQLLSRASRAPWRTVTMATRWSHAAALTGERA
jgi:glycosyltransferase involved in cell wall biosynthesis